MSALIAFRNELNQHAPNSPDVPLELVAGQVISGSLNNLLTRQLDEGATLWPSVDYIRVRARVPRLYGLHHASQSHRGVRMLAALGMQPVVPPAGSTHNPVLRVYAGSVHASNLLAEVPMRRLDGIDPDVGPINRICPLPSVDTDGHNKIEYVFEWVDAQGPVTVGRLWISNAVQIPEGVDADWSWGVTDAGQVAVSRGGQAYANPASVLRTLSANLSGPALDSRSAFGIPRQSQWESASLAAAATHVGTTGNVIVVPRCDAEWVSRTTIYGRLTQPISISHIAGNYYSTRIEVVEER